MNPSMDHYFTREMPMGDITSGDQVQPGMNRGQSFAKFYKQTVQDHALSASRNRFVGREVAMIRIFIPGDRNSIVERRKRPKDETDFPKAWAAFVKMDDAAVDGTPLEHWPMLSRAQVEDYKYNNIFTVEQLAELPDTNLSALGLGARRIVEHAKAFLETAKKGQVSAELVARNQHLEDTVSKLTSQLEELTRRFEAAATKAGDDVADIENPINEARVALSQASGTTVNIPDGFEDMGLPALKKLCEQIDPNYKVLSKKDATALIADYQAQAKAA